MFEKLGFVFWGFVIAAFQFGVILLIKFLWGFDEVGLYITAQLFIAALVPILSLDYHRHVDFLGALDKAVFAYRRQCLIIFFMGTAVAIGTVLIQPHYLPQVLSGGVAAIYILTRTFVKNNLSKYSLYYLDILRWVICYLCLGGLVFLKLDFTLATMGYVLAITNLAFLGVLPHLVSRCNLFNKGREQGAGVVSEIKKSAGFLPYSLSGFIITNIDRIYISTALGVAELGIYAWIQNIAAPLKVVTNNVTLFYSRLKFSSAAFDRRTEVKQQAIVMGSSALILYGAGLVFLMLWPVTTELAPLILLFLIAANLTRGVKQHLIVNNYGHLKYRKPLADLIITAGATIALLPVMQMAMGLSGVALFSLMTSVVTVTIWRYL